MPTNQPYTHTNSYSGDYDYSTLADYAKAFGQGAGNSASLGFYQPDQALANRYPTTSLLGNIAGNIPLTVATGGASLPAQIGINAGANALTAYNNGDSPLTAGLIGGAAPVVGKGVAKAAGMGWDALRGGAGAALNVSRDMTPIQRSINANATDLFAHRDAYDTMRQIGQRAGGLMDAIRRESDPTARQLMQRELDGLNTRYNNIANSLSMSQDEVNAGIRNYVKNFVKSNEIDNLSTTSPERFRAMSNLSPEMHNAVSTGLSNVYADPRAIAATSRNVSQLIPTELINTSLQPKSSLSQSLISKLSGMAHPSAATKQDYIDAYLTQNLPRYSSNQLVGNKVIGQEAVNAYERKMLEREAQKRMLESAGNLLGASATRSLSN